MLPDLRVRQRDYLLEITRALTQELDLDKLLLRILRFATEILAGQLGLVILRSETGAWKLSASHGIPAAFLQYLDPLLAQVPLHDDPARFEIPEINRLLHGLARATSMGALSGVGIPLIANQKVIGVIFILRGYAGHFSLNDHRLLQSFADQAAIAVNNAQLYQQSQFEKQRMGAILDSVADGMLVLEPDHTIVRCNPAFIDLWGEPNDAVQGKRHEEVIKLIKIETGVTLDKAEAGGWPLTPNARLYVEGDLERPNSHKLPVGITYSPMVSESGTLLNIIVVIRDLTRLREADELKSTFISVISHELKTPVALIKGYAGTLRREDANWEPAFIKEGLEIIEEESDRLTEMIENLLDATRLQAGGLKLHFEPISIAEIANRLAERFMTQVNSHTIVTRFANGFPLVYADEERMIQVISNLISNAIKYSPKGGEIEISGQVRQDRIIICVKDDGPGIAPGDIPFVFDRFYRSNNATRNTKGAGLGLFLSRAVIEAHGGRIWVDPNPGEGARICFDLPQTDKKRFM